ncbi:hypothetical protein Tco_1357386 [Tanacetum coccineum]
MENTRFKPKELLPYGMLLTRLFKHVVSVSPELAFDHYLSHDRAMHLLAPHNERKTRADRGMVPLPPLKIHLPYLSKLMPWLMKMMMNHFIPILRLILNISLFHRMLFLESIKTLLMKVMT